MTATRAAAALPSDTTESNAGSSQHHGNANNTLTKLVRSVLICTLPSSCLRP